MTGIIDAIKAEFMGGDDSEPDDEEIEETEEYIDKEPSYLGVKAIAVITALLIYGGAFVALPIHVALGMIIGTALLPLLSMMGVGYYLGDALGNLHWKLAAKLMNGFHIQETSRGSYRLLPYDDEIEPDAHVARLYGVPLGVSWEREPEVFSEHSRDPPHEVEVDDYGSTLTTGDVERGGHKTYIDTRQDPDDLFVDAGGVLEQGRHLATVDATEEAEDHALEEHGGNTSSLGDRVYALVVITVVILGIIIGILFI